MPRHALPRIPPAGPIPAGSPVRRWDDPGALVAVVVQRLQRPGRPPRAEAGPGQRRVRGRARLRPRRLRCRLVVTQLAQVPLLGRPRKLIRSRLRRIATQTIYDVLAAGVEVGLVRRFESAGFGARYELCFEKHDHLMCRACGRLEVVPDGIGLDMHTTDDERCGYRVEEIIFRGVCSACLGDRP
jgi:hypothetical protein